MIIAIDGPAGVGKSTISKMIAEKMGFYYLNSGNYYRGITYNVLKNKLDPTNNESNERIAEKTVFEVVSGRFFVDGEDVEDKLHTRDIDLNSSKISVNPKIREIVNLRIHELTQKLSVVAEGRDMTTVVFPNAECKFFFDAEPEVRAKRRYDQNPSAMDYDLVLKEINERDFIDRNKPVGGLKISADANYIDTSYLTIEEVCGKVVEIINNYINK